LGKWEFMRTGRAAVLIGGIVSADLRGLLFGRNT
jgi:hypothetical protein